MALRVAGRHVAALEESIAAMVLGTEDTALIEQARGQAAALDTETDPHLLIRFQARFAASLAALGRRSDLGRARAEAAEAAERAAAEARRAGPNRLELLRARGAEDERKRAAYNARESRRARRLAAQGLDMDAVAARMKITRRAVELYLAVAAEPEQRRQA